MKATTTRDSSKLSQALPVLGLFILGMLAGTIYNRSGSGRAIQSAEDLRLVANPPAGGVGLAPVVNGLNGHDEVNSIKDDENDKNVFRESVPDFDPFAHQTSSVADRTGPIENVDLVSLDGKVEEEDSSTETSDHHSIARKEKCKSESSEYTHGQVSRIYSYQAMYDSITNMLKCGQKFVFVSYDHEALLLSGHVYSLTYHTGHFGTPLAPHSRSYQVLRNDIIDSLQFREGSYYYGVPVPPCTEELREGHVLGGGNMTRLLPILNNLEGLDPRRIAYNTLFTHLSYDRSESLFQKILKEHKDAYFVSFQDSITLGEDRNWKERLIHIPVDTVHKWDMKRDQTLDRLSTFVTILGKSKGDPILLVSAGVLTNVLIHQMYLANDEIVYLNVDGLLVKGSASAMTKPDLQLYDNGTTHGNGVGGQSKEIQCTFSEYEREGDCVKAPGDKELSPLCFSKGAKGKPVAGRTGGFFPHDHDRRETIERERKEAEKRRKREELLKKKQAKLAKKKALEEEQKAEQALDSSSIDMETPVESIEDRGGDSDNSAKAV